MDLFSIHGIVKELREEVNGGFISKIFQINRTDLLFRIRHLGDEKQLLISTHPDFYRLHLTGKKYVNPPTPPRFCTYLRKHTLGARIQDITQDPYERIVRVSLQARMDAEIIRTLTLVAELAGKQSNVLLLEGDRILDCLRFVKAEEGASRPQIPGAAYVPPPPRGWTLPEVTLEKMQEIFTAGGEPWKILIEKVSGISPLWAREIDFCSAKNPEGYWRIFQLFRERYENGEYEPLIASSLGGKKVLAPFRLQSLGPAPEEKFLTLNQAADVYYFETVTARQMAEQKLALTKRLKQFLSRLEKRKENLTQDRAKLERDLTCREQGELLVANYGKMKKGMGEVEVEDFKMDPPASRVVPLDKSLDPAGNVERYFKKYKKAKRGLEFAAERTRQTDREIAYLDSALFQTEEAEDAEELAGIRKELEEERVLPPAAKPKGRPEKREIAIPVRRYRSSQGLEIFCGKHNVGNDYLLRHLAKGNDLWFHAQGMPGSHVLLKVGKDDPPYASILEAAMVAALHSRGRHSTRLPVDYTAAKNVHRPKGARPGLVSYLHQKTVFVAPDREKVEKLMIGER